MTRVGTDLSPRRIAKYYETLSEAGVIKITTSYRPHHIIEADDGTQSKAIYHVGQLTTYGHGEQVQMTGTLSFEATKCHNDGRWRFARMDWRFDQVVQVVLTERIAVVEVEAADQWSAWYRSYLEQALSSEEKLVRKMAKWEEGRTAASMVRIEESQIFPETVMDYMQARWLASRVYIVLSRRIANPQRRRSSLGAPAFALAWPRWRAHQRAATSQQPSRSGCVTDRPLESDFTLAQATLRLSASPSLPRQSVRTHPFSALSVELMSHSPLLERHDPD